MKRIFICNWLCIKLCNGDYGLDYASGIIDCIMYIMYWICFMLAKAGPLLIPFIWFLRFQTQLTKKYDQIHPPPPKKKKSWTTQDSRGVGFSVTSWGFIEQHLNKLDHLIECHPSENHFEQGTHLSNEKNTGWLGYIGDYTTQLYRYYNKPL